MNDNLAMSKNRFMLAREFVGNPFGAIARHEMERAVHSKIPRAYAPIHGRKTTEVVEELCDED